MMNNNDKWYGNIPSSWQEKTIKECFSLRNTKVSDIDYEPLSVTMLEEGVVKQLDSAAKSDAHDDRKLVKENDFVINSRSDRRMASGVSKYDGSVSLINLVLEPKNLIYPRFCHYLFKNPYFAEEFYKYGHGIVADLWSTQWDDMKKIYIPIPDLETQKNIANYLDKKIMIINQLIDNIKVQVDSLKKYKFRLMDEVINSSGNNQTKLKYLCTYYSSNLAAKDLSQDKSLFPVFGAGGIMGYSKDYEFDKEYIGIVKDGAGVGRVNIYPPKSSLLGTMGYIIPNDGVDIRWLADCITSMNLSESIDCTTIPHIYFSDYGKRFVNKSNLDEQNKCIGILNSKKITIDNLIKLKLDKIEYLIAYKNSLVYEAVTGKISIA